MTIYNQGSFHNHVWQYVGAISDSLYVRLRNIVKTIAEYSDGPLILAKTC
jgi:hypothetical protein